MAGKSHLPLAEVIPLSHSSFLCDTLRHVLFMSPSTSMSGVQSGPGENKTTAIILMIVQPHQRWANSALAEWGQRQCSGSLTAAFLPERTEKKIFGVKF